MIDGAVITTCEYTQSVDKHPTGYIHMLMRWLLILLTREIYPYLNDNVYTYITHMYTIELSFQ